MAGLTLDVSQNSLEVLIERVSDPYLIKNNSFKTLFILTWSKTVTFTICQYLYGKRQHGLARN